MPKLLNELVKQQNAAQGQRPTLRIEPRSVEDNKRKSGRMAPAKPMSRKHLDSVYTASQSNLGTTYEQKRIEEERVYQDEVEALKRARRRVRALKARTNDQTRKFKPEAVVKVIKKVHKPSSAAEPTLPVEPELELVEIVEEQAGEEALEAENEEEAEEQPLAPEALETEEAESEEEEDEELPETPSKQRPVDWFTQPYKEGDNEVEVGTESVPISDKPRGKMYSVAVQVILHSQALGKEELQRWALGEKEGEGWQEYTGEMEAWDAELETDPEFQRLSPEEKARLRAERKLRLERKASLRADALTLARPTFYRELPIKTTMEDALVQPKETQTTEYDIEQTDAARRGLSLQENNILWPTCKEFNIELGEMKIEDYIRRCWKLDIEWLYHTRLIQTHTTDFRKKYIYEVMFSTPTAEVPVPPATALVYFVFEVVKYGSIEDSVKVSYVLEGTRYPHIPGQAPFQQKWLQGIVADKLSVQRRIDF